MTLVKMMCNDSDDDDTNTTVEDSRYRDGGKWEDFHVGLLWSVVSCWWLRNFGGDGGGDIKKIRLGNKVIIIIKLSHLYSA